MHKMGLSQDLINAACSLGRALRADPNVQAYLQIQARLQADTEASALEKRLYSLYEELLARQQAGEDLSQAELEAFYSLRRQVQTHPGIVEREATLRLLKPYFADITDELNLLLGVDFTALARITED